jgi:DNA-binding transcriptional LysR family regulator
MKKPSAPMPQQISAMAVFVRVVESNSFSAAAEILGVSKSAVSKQVARLETELGTRLLRRTTRSLSTTQAGELLYERASQAFALLNHAGGALSELAQEPHGKLRVTAPVTYGRWRVIPRLPQFLKRYPRVEVQLVLLDRPVDLAAEGFDIAIRLVPKLPGDLIARPLGTETYKLVASPGFFARNSTPRQPSDLQKVNCLRYEASTSVSTWHFSRATDNVKVHVTGNVVVNNSDALRELAVHGAGVTVLPSFLADDEIKRNRLVELLRGWQVAPPFAANAHIVWLPDRYMTPKARAFVDYMVAKQT